MYESAWWDFILRPTVQPVVATTIMDDPGHYLQDHGKVRKFQQQKMGGAMYMYIHSYSISLFPILLLSVLTPTGS